MLTAAARSARLTADARLRVGDWQPEVVAQAPLGGDAARAGGLPVCYTVDAGPNVHCLCLAEAAPEVERRLREELSIRQIITERFGHALHEVMRESRFFRGKTTDANIIGRPVALGKTSPENVTIAPVLPTENRDGVRQAFGPEIG